MAANGLVLVRIAYNIIVVSIPYKRVRAKCIALSAVVQDAFLLNTVLNLLKGNLFSLVNCIIYCVNNIKYLLILNLASPVYDNISL